MATVTDREPRQSLWALGIVLLVGALIVVAALVMATRVRLPDTEKPVVDALVEQARSITPAGAREVRLSRFECGQLHDSAPPTVRRELVARAASAGKIRDELMTAYVEDGWQRNGTDPGESLEKGFRFATVSIEGSVVTLEVADLSVMC